MTQHRQSTKLGCTRISIALTTTHVLRVELQYRCARVHLSYLSWQTVGAESTPRSNLLYGWPPSFLPEFDVMDSINKTLNFSPATLHTLIQIFWRFSCTGDVSISNIDNYPSHSPCHAGTKFELLHKSDLTRRWPHTIATRLDKHLLKTMRYIRESHTFFITYVWIVCFPSAIR